MLQRPQGGWKDEEERECGRAGEMAGGVRFLKMDIRVPVITSTGANPVSASHSLLLPPAIACPPAIPCSSPFLIGWQRTGLKAVEAGCCGNRSVC